MGISEITALVGSLGFPITVCIFLAWYLTSKFEKLVESIVVSNKEFRATIEENTKFLQELIFLVKERSVNIENEKRD